MQNGMYQLDNRISVANGIATITFDRFDLESYRLFLDCKRLPEVDLEYAWQEDTYRVRTQARFLRMLGLTIDSREAAPIELAGHLFDYQRYIVRQALAARRYAIYADCGLGKTCMYLEWARHVMAITGGRVLVVSPLNIIEQSVEEARRFYGESLPIARLQTREALLAWLADGQGLAITNYEKLVEPTPQLRQCAGIVLDESSILKSGGGKIKWNLIKGAKGVEYKLSCTATPAPNDLMEYASQASFLEKLRNEGEIMFTFFSRDKRGNWRIKPHAIDSFYRFMASWSIYLRSPAVYGWADNLATIPPPEFHEVRVSPTRQQLDIVRDIRIERGRGMFGSDRLGVTERGVMSQIAKGFRYVKGTDAERIDSLKPAEVASIIRAEIAAGRQVLVWTVFDEESEIIMELLADVDGVEMLTGRMKERDRTPVLERFRHGASRVLISKASMLGYGLNFQFCTAMVFSGWDDSYERFYQAVRRAYRFGQTETVHVWIPYIDELEGPILANVLRKKEDFEADAERQEHAYRAALCDVRVL